MIENDGNFDFVDAGRTFTCRVEAARAPRADARIARRCPRV